MTKIKYEHTNSYKKNSKSEKTTIGGEEDNTLCQNLSTTIVNQFVKNLFIAIQF